VRNNLTCKTPGTPLQSFANRELPNPYILGLFVLATQLVALLPASAAQSPPSKPRLPVSIPLPPVRPAQIGIDAPVPMSAPVVNPTPPTPPSTQTAETPATPRSLPPANRARMHECGLEWQKMKETGAAANQIWFDFARLCLTK